MTPDDLGHLRCPTCAGAMTWHGHTRRGQVTQGELSCGCGARWPVKDGLPRLVKEDEVDGTDKLMRVIYDNLAPLHDPFVRVAFRACGTGSERALRGAYIPRLELDRLRPREDGQPVRILEIGIGSGANVQRVRRALPPGLNAEIWGLDLAEGMINVLRRRLRGRWRRGAPVKLMLGDAHRLPFPDGFFDRVFHVGATNSYRDPKRAVAEMTRVARPGTPVMMCDERLDSARHNTLYHRAMFKLVTFYDPRPVEPMTLLPDEATDVLDEQPARFFYVLTWRASQEAARA